MFLQHWQAGLWWVHQCCCAHPLCNPISHPRAEHWDDSAVTVEQHLHVTQSSASSGAPQVPTKAVDLPRSHPEVPVLTLPCSAPLWEGQGKATPWFN